MTAGRLSSESGKVSREFNTNVFGGPGVFSTGGPVRCSERLNGGSGVFGDILRKLRSKEIPGKEYVEEYLRDQHRRHCRPNTLRSTLSSIDTFLSFVKASGKSRLDEIIREDLFSFVEHEQDRGMKPLTVNTRVRILMGFIRFLVDKAVVRSDIVSRRLTVKVPDSLPKAMDPNDVKSLLTVIDNTRDRAMLLVLLRSGMRIGELLHLMVREVNLKERKVEIYEAEKTRVGRVVYLSEDARAALRAWFKERDSEKKLVFYAQGRCSMSYNNARMRFRKYLAKAGLSHRGYTLHCLRHTCASELLNAGMPLECLQQLLGHSSIEMTRRYARLTDKTREKEYFHAMSRIERGEIDGIYRLDPELPEVSETKKFFDTHGEKLPEHP
jgi:site-specific recombinase XerD